MVTDSPTTRYFSAAVHQFLEQAGHGAQADLARRARVSPSYLNDLLSGRKAFWPDAVKERIAQVCGFSVSELLEIGEHYVRDGVFWPHSKKVADTAAGSIERMSKIYQIAAKEVGVGMGHVLFNAAVMKVMLTTVLEEYRLGIITDARLYTEAIRFCRSILTRPSMTE